MIINKTTALNKIKLIIFDFDGTLVDSETVHFESDKKVLYEQYGIDLTPKIKEKYIGRSAEDMMEDIKRIYEIKDSVKTMVQNKFDAYLELALENVKLYSHMEYLLQKFQSLSIPMAVASGSWKYILEKLIEKLNITSYFDIIVSAEEVKKGKPHPDIFIETAKRMDIANSNTLVFEDSISGIIAAKEANMMSVAIPYIITNPLEKTYYNANILYKEAINNFDPKQLIQYLKEWL